MEISLDELLAIQSALINIKMVLTEGREMDADKLKKIVDEAYEIVMKKNRHPRATFHL